jgi:glycosyltransferase involved in cell wall biosynthesis
MSQTLPRLDEDELYLESGITASGLLLETAGSQGGRVHADRSPQSAPTGVIEEESQPPVIELAIPVYNEARTLEKSVRRLRAYLDESFPFKTSVRIVDNASIDETWEVATRLAATLPGVSALRLDQKGKGRAVRAAWSTSEAQIVGYMDVDLSTDLGGLLPLVAPLLSGHSDVSIGSRLAPGAHVLRGARREMVSRVYHIILRLALRNRFSDATCGFKAARREAAAELLPLVSDEHWFFDTELLVAAERNGFRIHEVPVDWIDDGDSRVNIRSVAHGDLKGIARLMRNRAMGQENVASGRTGKFRRNSGQNTRYAEVGILSTVVYLAVFLALRRTGHVRR